LVEFDTIQRLVSLMVEHDLAEIAIRDGQEEISLKRANMAGPAGNAAPAVAAPAAPPVAAPAPAIVVAAEDPDAGLLVITSPMVGTFYTAPDPNSPVFVKVGDHVTGDTVVCIIEAMKVFNEIKAGVSGTIRRILAPNESAVEYGQVLFKVQPG
jgi:acetyl-CoA carboxylase biotin carboxyl carrier protein